jgi:hypothetical protein
VGVILFISSIFVQLTEQVLKTSSMGFDRRGFIAGVNKPALGRALAEVSVGTGD